MVDESRHSRMLESKIDNIEGPKYKGMRHDASLETVRIVDLHLGRRFQYIIIHSFERSAS